jgi:hypothetical protein
VAQSRHFWAIGPAAACRGSSWSINSAAAQGRSIKAGFRQRLLELSVQGTVLGIRPTAAQGHRFWAMGPAATYRGNSSSISSTAAQGRSIKAGFRQRLLELSVRSTFLGIRPTAAQSRRFWAVGPAATCRGSSRSISSTAAQGRSIRACVRKRLFELGVPSIS